MSTLTPLPHSQLLESQATITAVNSFLLSHCPLCRAAAVPVPLLLTLLFTVTEDICFLIRPLLRYWETLPWEPKAKVCPRQHLPADNPVTEAFTGKRLVSPVTPVTILGWPFPSAGWRPSILQFTRDQQQQFSGCSAQTPLVSLSHTKMLSVQKREWGNVISRKEKLLF